MFTKRKCTLAGGVSEARTGTAKLVETKHAIFETATAGAAFAEGEGGGRRDWAGLVFISNLIGLAQFSAPTIMGRPTLDRVDPYYQSSY